MIVQKKKMKISISVHVTQRFNVFRIYWIFLRIYTPDLQMRLKMKQSNPTAKHFLLPTLKQLHQGRYTPRNKQINQSLPKIAPSFSDQRTYIPLKYKLKTQPNHSLALQKEKETNFKRGAQVSPALFGEIITSNDYEEGNITSNFKRQVEKNLIMIKKQKEYQKKGGERARYNTPRHLTIQVEKNQQKEISQREQRCLTDQESVFKKLNQIIIKSQDKSLNELDESRSISYSSYINNKKNRESLHKLDSERMIEEKKVKRSMSQLKRQLFKTEEGIKNQGNYHEWRKLSIDSDTSKKINYNISSFEKEAARLEKIRSKNELSLKKYIEGKSYLQKLANYRQSAEILG